VRAPAYEAALSRLRAQHLIYDCSCTRAEIAAAAAPIPVPRRRVRVPGEPAEVRYTGTCRQGPKRPAGRLATRFRVDGFPAVPVEDRLQPPFTQSVDATVGDFVLRRRDGYYAYQLAVVVDDAEQGITDVVRGLDLYDNTPRQRLLQIALDIPPPSYLHLPLVVDGSGTKLSKSRRAVPADPAQTPALLATVLRWLGLPPPELLRDAPVTALLPWALAHWNPSALQGVTAISSTS
jgi:glutamyl-Q tRNA(Asp) synthetase